MNATIQKLNPYVLFNGTAEKAIKLYESALGARTENLSRYGAGPCANVPPEQKDLVMHAVVHIGENLIMVSDTTPDRSVPEGGNVEIARHFSEVPEMEKAFEALAAGGKVRLPLQDMFWGARFGMLTDAYGVNWMFSCELKKA
jgi:PhnB protein